MRELSNVENDPEALMALSKGIIDFAAKTRYLLIPAADQLIEAVILLRRMILISHKVLPAKSYFNLLRDLQRIAVTSDLLAKQKVEQMKAGSSEEDQQATYRQFDAHFKASLAAHQVGEVEGPKIASMVRHRLCTEDVFCAACAFLQLEVSKRGSIYYIRGESPEFLETKKNRDPMPMDDEITLKTLASNIARPDAERGTVEQTQIAYGFNLLTKLYQLFSKMPLVIRWIKEGENLANPRHKVDVRAHFHLTLRDYDTVMVMARQMGLRTIKRKAASTNKYTLVAKVEERLQAEALRRGYTANRTLNVMMFDFIMLLDARHRAQKSMHDKPTVINLKLKKEPHGKAGTKRSS